MGSFTNNRLDFKKFKSPKEDPPASDDTNDSILEYIHSQYLRIIDSNHFHLMPNTPFIRYIEYKDSKYRVTHYIEPILNDKKIFNEGNIISNRKNAKFYVEKRNKILSEVRNNGLSVQGIKYSKAIKENGLSIKQLDIKYISSYISNPDDFIKNNKVHCDVNDLNKTYSKHLAKITLNEDLKSNFKKLKSIDEKISFLKINSNYNKVITSKAHCELLISKSFSSRKIMDAFAKTSASGIFVATSGFKFVYDLTTSNSYKRPLAELVANTLVGSAVSIGVPMIISSAGIVGASPILITGAIIVTTAVAANYANEFVDNVLGLTEEENESIKNDIRKDINKNKVYNAICDFYIKYSNFLEIRRVLESKKNDDISQKRDSLNLPKADILDPIHFKPNLKLPTYLNLLCNINIVNNLISRYMTDFKNTVEIYSNIPSYNEYREMHQFIYFSETTQRGKNYAANTLDEKYYNQEIETNKRVEKMLNKDIDLFYNILTNWNPYESIFIPEEFVNTDLFFQIESYL